MIWSALGFAALVHAFAVLALAAIWSRRENRWRAAAIGIFLACLPLAALAAASGLGRAVPLIPGLTVAHGETAILGVRMDPGEAIYVMTDTSPAPRLYVLPWNRETADRLQQIMDRGGRDGPVMRLERSGGWYAAPGFHLPGGADLPAKEQRGAPEVWSPAP